MKTSASQFLTMVDYMEKNGDLNKPVNGLQGKQRVFQHWEKLSRLLNLDVTGDSKDRERWKKVWSDFKGNCKRKAAKIHQAASGTGGGPACKLVLSDLEQRVLTIMGPQAATGLTTINEAGIEISSSACEAGPSSVPLSNHSAPLSNHSAPNSQGSGSSHIQTLELIVPSPTPAALAVSPEPMDLPAPSPEPAESPRRRDAGPSRLVRHGSDSRQRRPAPYLTTSPRRRPTSFFSSPRRRLTAFHNSSPRRRRVLERPPQVNDASAFFEAMDERWRDLTREFVSEHMALRERELEERQADREERRADREERREERRANRDERRADREERRVEVAGWQALAGQFINAIEKIYKK